MTIGLNEISLGLGAIGFACFAWPIYQRLTGQAEAVRHGISRALITLDPELRGVLKKAGLLTRDSREKERKKYGQRGARARFQYSKR